ncbi:MAG TPA: acyltransferase [Marmoricola sp.]|nr:acyltransferase [Marmoricola sp.]
MTLTRPDDRAMMDRRFPTLNAVRAAGALMVVCTHTAFDTGQINRGWTGAALSRMDFGVTLFFILSGFLLSRPFLLNTARESAHPSWRHYFWKRSLRILPLYWVVVVAAMLLDPKNRDATVGDWVSQLTLTQLYRPHLLASSLTQMWSLCSEVAFYLVLPPLCLLLTVSRRHPGLHLPTVYRRAGVLAVAGLTWQVVVAPLGNHHTHYAQWLPGMLPWFLVGMVFAAISAKTAVTGRPHTLDRLGADLTGCWVVGAAAFAIACSPVAGPRLLLAPGAFEAGAKLVLYTVAGTFLVLPLVFGPELEGRARLWLTRPVPFWLGDISYGIFAIHMFMLNLSLRMTGIELFTGHFLTVLALTLSSSMVLAGLSFRFFERPILSAKNVRWIVRTEPPGVELGSTASHGAEAPATTRDR